MRYGLPYKGSKNGIAEWTVEQVITTWYTPKEKLPPEEWDKVICTISGRAGNVTFDHAIEMMAFDQDSGWWSNDYEFDELTVHAWCDLEPYKG